MITSPHAKDDFTTISGHQEPPWEGMRKGNHSAFTEIYRLVFSRLYRYGCRIAAESQVEEELQELFIHLWENRNNLPPVDSPLAYLLCALRNRLLDAIRQEKKNPVLPTGLLLDFNYELQDESYLISGSETLQKAIAKLSPQQKEVIYLLYFNELSATEVAEVLSLKIRTVYNTAHQAITALRKHLQKDYPLLYLIPTGLLLLFVV